MFLVRCRTSAALALAAVLTVEGSQSSPTGRQWPPEVQPLAPESPPLPPDEAVRTFHMPPGYRVELVASEPLIQEPVAIDWDLEGRLWAVEMPGFMATLTAENEHDPIGRVVVLEDADGDGRMDKRTVFADGLVLARSLKVLDRGVLVGEPPHVWLMRDTDGDLRMDVRELVTAEYGQRDVDPQNNANGFLWALDNRLYTAGQADIHLRFQKGALVVERTLRRGEWGVTQDDAGRVYRNTNESALHVDVVPTWYFARNPNLVRTRGSYERLATDNEDLNVVWPVRPNPGTNRAYQAGIDRPDGTLAKFTAVCAPLIYRGHRLPRDLYGNAFVAEPAGNLVSRIVLGDTARPARKAYERGEFLASTDERFRPVYLADAPDGTLYVADMYRGIIEHRISITEYLRDQILERRLDRPTGFGRIYRVVHDSTERDTSRSLGRAPVQQLVETLSHPSGWWRDTAQRLLVERGQTAAVPALTTLAGSAPDWRTRLHALWTLDGLDALEPAAVLRALDDQSPEVRTSAVRLAERWLAAPDARIRAALETRIDDPSPDVRRQLAASAGLMAAGPREPLVSALLERHGEDPIVMDAAISSLRGRESAVLERLMEDVRETAARAAAITMLAATVVRSAQEAASQRLFDMVADRARPGWQRSAVLSGAEVALLGASMPGRSVSKPAAPASSAAMPCPTCPGGRAGPGGAYAFPRPPGWPSTRRGGGVALRLTRPPSLAASADAKDQRGLGPRIRALLALVSWPGKAGEGAPVAPLTSAEETRFRAGQEVYRNLCQACHQPDGRGQERVAPALLGSPFALAPDEVPIRILLHGKEGATGLMPPIGGTLSDEQIASVLTYVRREWGQAAAPVEPARVKAVRGITAGRSRPWTDAELTALVPPGTRREDPEPQP
jgi:mono/diheme cytochrome c family protein/glucose/arabinose dehydrogenase/HEAT repeat protein